MRKSKNRSPQGSPPLPTHATRSKWGWSRGLAAAGALALLSVVPTTNIAVAAATCSIDTPTDNVTVKAGKSVTYGASASGGGVRWTFEGGTPTSLRNSTSATVAYNTPRTAPYTTTLRVGNGGSSCTDTVTVTVESVGGPVNTPPVVTTPADQSNVEDDPVYLAVSASDADNDTLSYSATNLPTGLAINSVTGQISGTISPGASTGSPYGVTVDVSDGTDSASATFQWTITAPVVEQKPTARGDTYATPVGQELSVEASRVSGVLYNDFDPQDQAITAQLVSGPSNAASFALNADGSFAYTPVATLADNSNDSFTYRARDTDGNLSEVATVNLHILSDQPDFKIMMNYELGMHCTGFEFSYCCVLPPYNSILAQVVKPQTVSSPSGDAHFPRLLEGDPKNGLDGLGRETVLRDYDISGNFHKYYLEYYHDAQPRNEGQGAPQSSTLISDIEGNSMLYHNTPYDSAAVDANGKLLTGSYNGADGVVLGDGDYTDPTDNYANGWLNHFYIYSDLEGSNPDNSSLEADKIRLGVTGHVEYPANVGAALQPMGPISNGQPSKDEVGFDNVLTFSGDTGTVVYTQSKVLENLPIMLTSPRIWEALGMPLTPFEDSIGFFADPGLVDEDSIRPYVAMKARLHEASCNETTGECTKGAAVIGSNGHPVIGFGTAPIDIPNCERCHSAPSINPETGQPNVNSPNYVRDKATVPAGSLAGMGLEAVTEQEINYWMAYYEIDPAAGDSDWYPRLKGAAINMMVLHDFDNGTSFTASYPATGSNPLDLPMDKAGIIQNTRLGKESVICQKCHADNVIAAVKSATKAGTLIKPISEAIHWRHREVSEGGTIAFADGLGRSGGCQGCHPAHRSDGVMDDYPITLGGDNANADGDNRLNQGGCFVGRDVHSNPLKDVDGAETPAHLNAVGSWLAENVFHRQANEPGGDADTRGIWCTNCHTQLGQEIWRAEDCEDLINGDCVKNVRGMSLQGIAGEVAGGKLDLLLSWLDPKDNIKGSTPDGIDHTHSIWDPEVADANVATIEVDGGGNPVVTEDGDGDISVNILSFCTTDDCVSQINGNKASGNWPHKVNDFIDPDNHSGAAVPFSAATDGRDHWLAAGEPHCADCHAAPYVEQSGNINPFPPFNYPRKAGLMRYSRGHQDISCQGCHESIHGLYPVSPAIDTTTYAQAAALNHDGSHGPLKCGTCHTVNSNGIPNWIRTSGAVGGEIGTGASAFDNAVTWAHTYTDEASVLDTTCQNCHRDFRGDIRLDSSWLIHSERGRTSREMMDKAEIERRGHVYGDPAFENPLGMCQGCHGNESSNVSCSNSEWRQHLTEGRVAHKVWESVTEDLTGGTCGW